VTFKGQYQRLSNRNDNFYLKVKGYDYSEVEQTLSPLKDITIYNYVVVQTITII